MLSKLLLVSTLLGVAGGSAIAQGPVGDPSEAFFNGGAIPRIQIRVDPAQLAKLRADPRNYVKAEVREDDRVTYADVAIKLKGAAGSYRDWNDRPALTLNMRKFRKGDPFHGLTKFHLNNSAQDDTCLSEVLCSDLFRRAGVPAARATHARVWLNGRDVGLYVLKEGFDDKFLERWFPDPSGNLYDGGFLQDVDAALEKDEGTGPDDRSDLKAIVEAARDPDPINRARRIEALVDIDEFCAFMAIERMTVHWDGYADKANNYRVYFNPQGGRAVFLPHGMDQMFSETEWSLFGPSDKIVASVVLKSDALRKRYRASVEKLVPLMSPPDDLIRRVDEIERRLRPVILAMDRGRAAGRVGQINDLKGRLVARAASLRKQLAVREPTTLDFDDRGVARLPTGWWSKTEVARAVLEEAETRPGKKALSIRAGDGEPCVASWRHEVLLGPGDYTLRAEARTDRVVKLDNTELTGVGVGISGTARDQRLHGTAARTTMACRFRVTEERQPVVLVLELRAKSGRVWFDVDSLMLVRGGARDGR